MTRLPERTIGGLHDFLVTSVVPSHAPSGGRAVDLGAGSGALAECLREFGLEVTAVDLTPDGYQASVPFTALDLNAWDFASRLGPGAFDLVTAVEVIEHLESPIGFLRNVARLLQPGGVTIVTMPNVENLPARVKFLLTGKLRMMDERGDPTHVSPVFGDLLLRHYLPRAGLGVVAHQLYPPGGYRVTRARYTWALRILAGILPGDALLGDCHVPVLKRAGATV